MSTKVSAALPNKIWVGSYEFPLRVVPAGDPMLDNADGCTEFDENCRGIKIASNLATRHRLEIVIHEITHAINWSVDLEDGATEEDVATKHGRAWSQFLLDNPRYVAWLTFTLNKIRRERSAGGDREKVKDAEAEPKKSATPSPAGHAVQAGGEAGSHEVGGTVRGGEEA